MSKTPQDWKAIHNRATKIRDLLREASELLEEWPLGFDDLGSAQGDLESKIQWLMPSANQLVGECFADWAWEE